MDSTQVEKTIFACMLRPRQYFEHVYRIYRANEMTLKGFWAGGQCLKTSHPGWEIMVKGSHASLSLMRRYALEFFNRHGRAVPVAEGIAMVKRAWAIYSFRLFGPCWCQLRVFLSRMLMNVPDCPSPGNCADTSKSPFLSKFFQALICFCVKGNSGDLWSIHAAMLPYIFVMVLS